MSGESQVAVQVERLLDRTEEDWLIERLRAAESAWMYAMPMLLADIGKLQRIAQLRAAKTRADGEPRRMSAATIAEQERLGEMLADLLTKVNELRQMGQNR